MLTDASEGCSAGGAPTVNIISRAGWGAREPVCPLEEMQVPVSMVFIHHTRGSSTPCLSTLDCMERVRGVQNFHIDDREWSDIGYSFLVGEDGNAYKGRGWDKVGAHTYGFNRVAIAVCFIGNFEDRKPNRAALEAAQKLIEYGIEKGYIEEKYELFGHRDTGSTTCPGEALYSTVCEWPHFSTRPLKKHNYKH